MSFSRTNQFKSCLVCVCVCEYARGARSLICFNLVLSILKVISSERGKKLIFVVYWRNRRGLKIHRRKSRVHFR